MIKIDYYKFYVCEPKWHGDECHKTLRDAKQAYIKHLHQGHYVNSEIYGCTLKDDSISLTFTPWYGGVKPFGRTELTNIGYAVKIGKYRI